MSGGSDREPSSAGRATRSKVARVIDELELDGLGEELARRWRGDGGERRSLRELETDFNERVLSATVERAGERLLEGEAENLYRLLADDAVASGARTEAETKLERLGVDVERLRDRFVSHQAIHTYLTTVLEESAPGSDDSPETVVARRRRSIQRLRNRLAAVTEQGLEGLDDAGHVSVGSLDAVVGVTVHCRDCGSTYDVGELLDRGGCDCER